MSSKFFSIGLRVVTGDTAQQLRNVGNSFHDAVERQRRDIVGLNRDLASLVEKEKLQGKAHKDAQEAHKAQVKSAKDALAQNAQQVAQLRAEHGRLNVELSKSQSGPHAEAWRSWRRDFSSGTEAVEAYRAQIAGLGDTHRKMLEDRTAQDAKHVAKAKSAEQDAERAHRKAVERRTAIEVQEQKRLLSQMGKVELAKSALRDAHLLRGGDIVHSVIAPLIAQHEEAVQKHDERLEKIGRAEGRLAALQQRRNQTPTVQEQIREETARIQRLSRIEGPSEPDHVIASARRQALHQLSNMSVEELSRTNLNEVLANLKLSPTQHLRATKILDEANARVQAAQEAESLHATRLRNLPLDPRWKPANIDVERAEDQVQARRDATSALIPAQAQAHAEFRAQLEARAAEASAVLDVGERREGLKSRLLNIKSLIAGKLSSRTELQEDVTAAKKSTGVVDAAKAVWDSAKQEVAAKKLLIAATLSEMRAKQDEVRQIRSLRGEIGQHLMGAMMDFTMKLGFVMSYFKRAADMIGSAAKFHFEAQGLSSVLGATRGTGQDIYGDYARAAAYQTEISPTQAVARMGELGAAGYSRGQIGAATESIYNTFLAGRGEISEAGAFDLGISLDKSFGGKGQSMGDLLDTVVSVSNRSSARIGQIRDILGYATEAASMSGQSLDETLLMATTMLPIVKTPSKAGTSTRNAMMSLMKPGSQNILAGLGVSVKDESGHNRRTMDVFMDIRDALIKVQQQDMAGTYVDPFGKKTKPEERAAALDALNLKKEELEYKLTGQRGGSVFAMMERLPELAQPYLRGTPFEKGFNFASARDALEAMRLGLEETTGEARRMADELRKTSYMLGVSFDASVEKFKISLGTALLPMRDAFISTWKTLLDSITNWMNSGGTKEGQPGGAPPGSSIGMNMFAGATQMGAAWLMVSQVRKVFSALGMAKAMFDPRIMANAVALRGANAGMSAVEAVAAARLAGPAATMGADGVLVGAAARTGFLGFLGTAASAVAAWALPVTAIIGGLWMMHNAIRTSVNAIADFTYITEAANKARTDKTLGAIRAVMQGIAEGKIKLGKDGVVDIPVSFGKAIKQAPDVGAGMIRTLLLGGSPQTAMEHFKAYRERQIEATYPGEENAKIRQERLEEFRGQFKELISGESGVGDYMEQILRRDAGKDPSKLLELGQLRAYQTQMTLKNINTPVYGMEKGGRLKTLALNMMDQAGTNNAEEALVNLWFNSGMSSVRSEFADQRNKKLGGNWLGNTIRNVGAYMGGYDDMINAELKGVKRSDYDAEGRYLPDMPTPAIQLPDVLKDVMGATDLKEAAKNLNAAASTLNAMKVPLTQVAPATKNAVVEFFSNFSLLGQSPTRLVPGG